MTFVSAKSWLQTTTALTSILLVGTMLAPTAHANPEGGQVVAGEAEISAPDELTVQIDQQSQNAVIDWQRFDIAPGETTRFIQPNSSAWALNRVVGSLNPTTIEGALEANGNIAIVNPDGIVFANGARVDVNSLIATTHDISNQDFTAGKLNFNKPGNPAASVINEGSITIADEGLGAFVAPGVRNSGVITARLGTISLAAGNSFTLDLYGDGLVNLAIDDEITQEVIDVATGKPMADLVKNEGTLKADGGIVAMKASTVRQAVNSVINNKGVIEANSVGMQNGKIILGGATAATKLAKAPVQRVKVSGRLSAVSLPTKLTALPASKPAGGTIEITGEEITLASATIDASGTYGGGKVLIGGDYLGGRPLSDLYPVGEEIREDYEVATASTVRVDSHSTISASATEDGNGGKIVLWSDEATSSAADITAIGAGTGIGGFIETSSAGTLNLPEGNVTAGAGGLWLLDPEQLYVSATSSVFGNTEYVAASTIESALNSGTNVSLISTGADARTGVHADIEKTAGGDATLTLGSTGSVSITHDITSTSGELNISVQVADILEPFVGGSLTGFRDGELVVSGAQINTNGGDFSFRGAYFQITNTIQGIVGQPQSDFAPGQIRTQGGNMTFALANKADTRNEIAGYIGCNGFYKVSCGQSAFALDAGSGNITFSQNPNSTASAQADFGRIYVGDYGIRTTGELSLDGIYMRRLNQSNATNLNGINNIEFGTLTLLNDAKINFYEQDAPGITAATNTPPEPILGATLPTGDYIVGEQFDILLPTLFTDSTGTIVDLRVFRSGDTANFQIIEINGQKRLVGTYNGDAGTVSLTFEATDNTGATAQLVLTMSFSDPAVTPSPTPTATTGLENGTAGQAVDNNASLLCAQTNSCWSRNVGQASWAIESQTLATPVQAFGGLTHQEILASLHEIDDLFGGVVTVAQVYSAIDELMKLPAAQNAFIRIFGPVSSTDELLRYFSTPWGKHYLKNFKEAAATNVKGFIPTIADLLGGLAMTKLESEGHTDDWIWATNRIAINSAIISMKYSSPSLIDKADAFKDAAIWASEDTARSVSLLVEGASQADTMRIEVVRMKNYIIRTAQFVSENIDQLPPEKLDAYADAINKTTETMITLSNEINTNPGLLLGEFFRERVWRPWQS